MSKLAWYAVLSVVVVVLSGCGVDAVTSKEENLIGDVPAEKYYQQFLYRKDDGEDLPFRYLSQSLTKIRAVSQTENLYFSGSLYLLDDGKFALDYEEAQGNEKDGMTTTKPVFRKRILGKWRVEKTSLVLDGVGRGGALKYQAQDTVALSYQTSVHDAGVKNKSAVYYYTQSNKGMPDKFN